MSKKRINLKLRLCGVCHAKVSEYFFNLFLLLKNPY